MRAPNCCPICGELDGWILIDTTKKGFNAKKAIIGGVLLGGVGLAAGAFGKNKSLYICKKCNFQHEYDEEALKNTAKKNDFSGNNTNKVWIDIVTRATPNCQFCGKQQELSVRYNFNGGGYLFKCEHCNAEFSCDFTIGGKVKENSVNIINCGGINQNSFETGPCAPSLLILDNSRIKHKK